MTVQNSQNSLPLLPGRTLEEVEQLSMDLYHRRDELYYKDYEAQSNAFRTEILEIQRNARLMQLLKPTLEIDGAYAKASFGPLADEYINIRQDVLITWQPSTITKVESAITLARLIFRRQLIHKESGLFHNDKVKRRDEMREVKTLNAEIEKMTQQIKEQL